MKSLNRWGTGARLARALLLTQRAIDQHEKGMRHERERHQLAELHVVGQEA